MQNKLKIEDVVAGYNFVLGRNPEKELDLVNVANAFESIASFREYLFNSDEAAIVLYNKFVAKKPSWIKAPTIFGQQIYVCLSDIAVSREIILTSNWEPEVGQSILSLINQDSYFLDIGSNIGWFSMMVADHIQKRNGRGKVIAVEANPMIVQYLAASVTDAGLNHITSIKPYAVSNGYGIIQMEAVEEGNIGGLNIRPLCKSDGIKRNIIPTVVLDDILEDLPKLDLVKMDIEGAEPLALEGMKKMLDKFSPKIIMEINSDGLRNVSDKSVMELLYQMKSYGYKSFDIRKNGLGSQEISDAEVCRIIDQRGYYDFLFQKAW
jgi:FkbM family methyltransferase